MLLEPTTDCLMRCPDVVKKSHKGRKAKRDKKRKKPSAVSIWILHNNENKVLAAAALGELLNSRGFVSVSIILFEGIFCTATREL